jgi:hypothetical protein
VQVDVSRHELEVTTAARVAELGGLDVVSLVRHEQWAAMRALTARLDSALR